RTSSVCALRTCMNFSYTTLNVSSSFVFPPLSFSFFFNDPSPTDIYTLSLHDALPICVFCTSFFNPTLAGNRHQSVRHRRQVSVPDRKSTRLNSSHEWISYAVFCLKKKKKKDKDRGNDNECIYVQRNAYVQRRPYRQDA